MAAAAAACQRGIASRPPRLLHTSTAAAHPLVQVKRAMTMTEKILAKHSDKASVAPGDNVWTGVDKLLTHDVCGPGTFGIFQKEFGEDAQVRLRCGYCDGVGNDFKADKAGQGPAAGHAGVLRAGASADLLGLMIRGTGCWRLHWQRKPQRTRVYDGQTAHAMASSVQPLHSCTAHAMSV